MRGISQPTRGRRKFGIPRKVKPPAARSTLSRKPFTGPARLPARPGSDSATLIAQKSEQFTAPIVAHEQPLFALARCLHEGPHHALERPEELLVRARRVTCAAVHLGLQAIESGLMSWQAAPQRLASAVREVAQPVHMSCGAAGPMGGVMFNPSEMLTQAAGVRVFSCRTRA
jgi:hypothetical protein